MLCFVEGQKKIRPKTKQHSNLKESIILCMCVYPIAYIICLNRTIYKKTEIDNHQTLLNKITSQDFMEQPEVLSQIHNTNRKCTSMQTISQKFIVCINGMFLRWYNFVLDDSLKVHIISKYIVKRVCTIKCR